MSNFIPAVWKIKFKKDVEINIPELWFEDIEEESPQKKRLEKVQSKVRVTVPQNMQQEKHFENYDFSQDICQGVKMEKIDDETAAKDVLKTWYHDLFIFSPHLSKSSNLMNSSSFTFPSCPLLCFWRFLRSVFQHSLRTLRS